MDTIALFLLFILLIRFFKLIDILGKMLIKLGPLFSVILNFIAMWWTFVVLYSIVILYTWGSEMSNVCNF